MEGGFYESGKTKFGRNVEYPPEDIETNFIEPTENLIV
jgi:hypothetical protein